MEKHTTTSKHLAKAAMLLLVAMLTSMAAWATVDTYTYSVSWWAQSMEHYTGRITSVNSGKTCLDFSSKSMTNNVLLKGGNDAPYITEKAFTITFACSQDISTGTGTNSGSTFKVKYQNTQFTISITNTNNVAYKIKKVTFLKSNDDVITSVTQIPTESSVSVSLPTNTEFAKIVVELTDDTYYSVTPANGLKIDNTNGFATSDKTYFLPNTPITLAPKSDLQVITATDGTVSEATIAADKRSVSFKMPTQDINPSATLVEVHTVAISGDVSISDPLFTYNGKNYYEKGSTIRITAKNTDDIIDAISGFSGTITYGDDYKSASFTMPTSDLTLTATTSEVHTVSVSDNLKIKETPKHTYNNKNYYTPGTYTIEVANADDIIDKINGVTAAIDPTKLKSATFTVGTSDITITATTTNVGELSGITGMSISPAAYKTTSTTSYYLVGETYTLSVSDDAKIIKTINSIAANGISTNRRSATFKMAAGNYSFSDTKFTTLHTIAIKEDKLTVSTEPNHTAGKKSYYDEGTTITLTAPENHIIDGIKDNVATINTSTFKTATFEMPNDDITITATTSEVHTVSVPSNLTISGEHKTIGGTKYYKKGETYTLSAKTNEIIDGITISGVEVNIDESTCKTATFTMPGNNITISATTSEVHQVNLIGNTVKIKEDPYKTINGLPYYKKGVKYTLEVTDQNYIIVEIGGVDAEIYEPTLKTATFTVGTSDITITATTTNVGELSGITGMSISPAAYRTTSTTSYYLVDENYTISVTDDAQIIKGIDNGIVSPDDISDDRRSATFTMMEGNHSFSNTTFTTLHTITTKDANLTFSATPNHTVNGTSYYKEGTGVALSYNTPNGIIFDGFTVDGEKIEGSTFSMPAKDVDVNAITRVPYIDAAGNTAYCTEYTILTAATKDLYNLPGGWYVVTDDVNIETTIHSDDSFNFIICDDVTLTVYNGSNCNIRADKNISIYGQGNQTGEIIITNGKEDESSAGFDCANLIINGCNIDVKTLDATSVTLNWFNVKTRIKFVKYLGNDVTIAGGKMFYTEIDSKPYVVSGKLSTEQIEVISGKTLKPCYTLQFVTNIADFDVPTQAVIPGETPTDPNIKFQGKTVVWYSNAECTKQFDFTNTLTSNATAYTKLQVSYIDDKGESATCTDFTILTAATENLNNLPGGWYVVADDVTLNTWIYSDDKLNFIICDDKTLTFNNTNIESYENISIYGQTNQTGKISNTNYIKCTDLIINGCSIDVTGLDATSVTLNWFNANTRIMVHQFNSTNVTIADGKAFFSVIDGKPYVVSGTLTDEQIHYIRGMTLKPGYTLSFNNGNAPFGIPAQVVLPVEKPINPTSNYPGVEFSGWYSNAECTKTFDFSQPLTSNAIAYTKVQVSYIDADGESATCNDFTILTDATENLGDLPGGWYVVACDVTINKEIHSDYALNFIICDGATLTVNNNNIYSSNNISIYGQENQTGEISITSDDEDHYPYIQCPNLVINGCNIDVRRLNSDGVTLNWFNANTSIKSDRYNGNVTIADGKAFYTVIDDKPYVLSGKLTSEQILAIKGKTLAPCYALSFNNGNAPLGIPTQMVLPGNKPTDPSIKFQGKTLDWYSDAACNEPFVFTTPLTSNATAYTKVQVSYIDDKGESATCTDFTILTAATDNLYKLPGGWYVVAEDVNLNTGILSNGDLNLIICDGATLTVNNIASNNISIYGQTNQTGKITAYNIWGKKSVTINGGNITGQTKLEGFDNSTIIIRGGNISVSVFITYGGSVTFDFANSTGRFMTSFFYNNKSSDGKYTTYQVAEGKKIMTEDGSIFLSGTLTEANILSIAGKTLMLCDDPNAPSTAKDTYVINGDDEVIQHVISETVEVDEVILNRQFSQGIASTLILPFDYNASDFGEGSKFYKIEDVKYDEKSNQWTAEASLSQAKLSANCPYIFYPAQEITEPIVFNNPDGKITLHQTVKGTYYTSAESKWRLNSVYGTIIWSDRQDNIYGFAAKPVTNRDGEKIYAGEFVRAGRNSKIKPTRAYLEYVSDNGGNGGNISKSAVALPDRIVLVFPDETASVIDNPVDDPSTTGDDIETPTSEITPAANVKVWSYDKTIYIAAAPGTAYRIIDASGRPLRTSTTQSDRDEIHLGGKADGIVIVIIGGKAYKISY